MTEWLDVMLEEISRKQREADEARKEQERREQPEKETRSPPTGQPK